MIRHRVNLLIKEDFHHQIKTRWLRRLARETLKVKEADTDIELGLVITDDDTVRQLNLQFRNLNETTDVLSFALWEGGDSFILPPDGTLYLGDVLVSYPQAARQAEENKQPVEKELTSLVVHGILHLLGYDHQEPEAEARMKALEEKVLQGVESWQR